MKSILSVHLPRHMCQGTKSLRSATALLTAGESRSSVTYHQRKHRSGGHTDSTGGGESWGTWPRTGLAVVGSVAAIGAFAYATKKEQQVLAKELTAGHQTGSRKSGKPIQQGPFREAGAVKAGLPTYRMSEVQLHSTPEERVWVTYGRGVYDVTDFVPHHPGADKVMMAAGGALEPFWAMYAVHQGSQMIHDLLEKFRIGNLDPADEQKLSAEDDPFRQDPPRHNALVASSKKPFNAETPLLLLGDSFITPNALFYVRNHLPVPDIDPKTYELDVSGLGVRERTLSLDDIRNKYPRVTITAAIQCGGNRRNEMMATRPLKGLPWQGGAIGNAQWTGARLCDVLKDAGFSEDCPRGALHVQFEGADTDPASSPYGASIPIEKAVDPRGDVLLAYEMNGEPLSRDHGAPLRVIVPGTVGARNVKWLTRVIVSDVESDSHWQQNDYKGFSPSVDWDTVDFSKSPAIQDMPVTSIMCEPRQGDKVKVAKDRTITVSGYAWAGGGRSIVRVDVTSDGGRTWVEGRITDQEQARPPRHWAWTLWTAKVPVKKGVSEVEVWCKAVDSSYNTQPESFQNIWNLRGLLSNAYHRLSVKLQW